MKNRSLPADPQLFAGLFVLSSAVLMLELLGMRLLSFMLWHHLAYMVLSIALLGFGAAGSWLASFAKKRDPEATIVWSAILFGATNIAGFALLVHLRLDTFDFRPASLLELGLYYTVLLVPYFFAGVAIAEIFRTAASKTTSLYFANLAGSGAGCQLFMISIAPLGGPAALVLASLLGASAALIWSFGGKKRLFAAASAGVFLCAVALPAADLLIPAKPARSKSLAKFESLPGSKIEFSRWTPLSRIDVVYAPLTPHPFIGKKVPGNLMRTITIDGDANTWVFNLEQAAKAMAANPDKDCTGILKMIPYALPFLIKDRPETLIVGAGGGNEIAVALCARAKRVIGVEINSTILAQTTKYMSKFFGNLYDYRRAVPIVAEGRSFARRTENRFDIIQMSGVDTWSGLSSGAYVLGENYLYTVEAVKEFLAKLKPDGVLSVGRFLLWPPRESLRVMSNALRALKEIGVKRPQDHVIAMTRGNAGIAYVLVKRSPFTPEEVGFYGKLLTEEPIRDDAIWYAPHIVDKLADSPFLRLADAVSKGDESERDFYERYQYDVTPVYDDRPFFFEYYKWKNLFRDMSGGGVGGQIGANKPIGLTILLFMLGQASLLSALFIFAPLLRLRRTGSRIADKWAMVGGFGGLGLGFMIVEIALMQKLVLFLGHPTFSISVTLSSILVGSGLGSLVAGILRISARKKILIGVAAAASLISVYMIALGPVCDSLLSLPMAARQAVAVLIVGVVAFFMGMPFPISLACVSDKGSASVPWAFAINGSASVVGGIVCIMIAISAGFRVSMAAAALLYAASLPCLLRLASGSAIETRRAKADQE